MTRCEVLTQNICEVDADALVVGLFAAPQGDSRESGGQAGNGAAVYTASALEVENATSGAVSRVLATGDFTGARGEIVVIYGPDGVKARRVILAGLGAIDAFNEEDFAEVHRKIAAAARGSSIVLTSEDFIPETRDARWAARTALRVMLFEKTPVKSFKSNARPAPQLESVVWFSEDEAARGELLAALEEGCVCAEAMRIAKNLGDLPPNECTPQHMYETACRLRDAVEGALTGEEAARPAVTVEVMRREDLEKAGMGGILAVGRGSDVEPLLIEFSWWGAADRAAAPIVVVGKGVTFDAGGLNLKPGRSMPEMKYDMSGAAAALALVKMAADLRLPLNVVALAPCAENLPSGRALKPADIIRMGNSMTVEVLNADAEGRLLLADALYCAQRLNPAACVDVATLTGACVVALGTNISGLFCSSSELTAELTAAAESADDPVWPMPMGGRYRELLKSNCADLVNTGNQPHSGASTAATFLQAFAPKCPWAHLDVAGTANTTGADRQSTARPLPLLMEWLLARAQRA